MGLTAAGAMASIGAWALARFQRWRRKSSAELERLRRLEVNRGGRVTAGEIVDLIEPTPPEHAGHLIVYKYEVAGVTYEVAQDISALPGTVSLARRSGGQKASIKYDPKKPTNSIIACEEWCGVP